MQVLIIKKAINDNNGMVIKPKYWINFVVHDTPDEQNNWVSGII
jgi:hypothetical protein